MRDGNLPVVTARATSCTATIAETVLFDHLIFGLLQQPTTALRALLVLLLARLLALDLPVEDLPQLLQQRRLAG